MKICCFAGHANVYDETMADKIYLCARTLAEEENVTEFWLGNYGQFDRYAKTAIKRLKKERNIKMIAVIPYVTAEWKDKDFAEEYDEIIIADIKESAKRHRPFHGEKLLSYYSFYIFCCYRFIW
ncbi:MAG: hypothetical protein II359_00810 [Clostridia bacterium]|nr:hypothetical protein [Clostridia bacterium]